ncbi:hypothetical protein HZS61_008286 [Fusarium oxysporum f. sp. conglutinans]|nr:hypothetical protein HZS61_002451 [Fusarium oxysporum f. sp. conglutinans]KAF6527984.1 hypothetical protein HZS61_008286 [Fusarium oxysporum f. sp. conglutinans]
MAFLSGFRDERYPSHSPIERSRESVPTGFGRLHSHFLLRSPADVESDNLKKRLDQTWPLVKSPFHSLLSTSASDSFSQKPSFEGRFSPALSGPVHLHFYSRIILDSSARPIKTQIDSTFFRRSTSLFYGCKSPNKRSHINQSLRTLPERVSINDAASTNSTSDSSRVKDTGVEDGQSRKRLRFDDTYVASGQGNRAAEPNNQLIARTSNLSCRSGLSSLGSLQGRITTLPQVATTPSSSSSGISPTSYDSPHTAPLSLDLSTQIPIPSLGPIRYGTASDISTGKIIQLEISSRAKAQAFFLCECCPNRPKKFQTLEELNAHNAEKLWLCEHCQKRFKHKNDLKRHVKSLHVFPCSWSCSALSSYDRAFYDSTNKPGEADTCGYCGDEFSRSGRGPSTGAVIGDNPRRYATHRNWNERIRHLQVVHKFSECNASKKFFRADHFRQHLKYSHAGKSGKWTNMLEDACKLDEDPTPW